MISRIYVTPNKMTKGGSMPLISSYLIEHELSELDLIRVAQSLTNPALEDFSINRFPVTSGFSYLVEIGFLPGVTDNIGATVKETILDLLETSDGIEVYSSKIYLYGSKYTLAKVRKEASLLYNPLIERADIISKKELSKTKNLPLELPKVVLRDRLPVIHVSLDVGDEELKNIGALGVRDTNGVRRGPLALDIAYMKTIKAHFEKVGRAPTDIELESLAQTWSEHCKHTIFANPIDDIKNGLYKTYIKGATEKIRKDKGTKDFCVSVFSDNAGGIIFDENNLVAFKVETHNSPSALDPYGGAMTGIGGVNRDIIGFGLGAKPVANTYGFCLGMPEDTRALYRDKDKTQKMLSPKRIMDGVIRGVNHYGNTSGIPTPSGFLRFDDRYRGKPLVFAGTVGMIPRKINNKLSHQKSAQVGDYVVVIGGRVGRDGIHGATFSSVAMDSGSPATAVQIGDPITQKKLSDALIKETRDMDLYNSITDCGAGGISCSVAEMAKEVGGADVDIEKVPLKYPNLQPWEIWISESQERITLAVPKKKWEVFNLLMKSRGVEATIIGEFNDSGRCRVLHNGRPIMDMEMEFLHNGLPKQELLTSKVTKKHSEPVLGKNKNFSKTLEDLLKVKNISGYGFVSSQYDHEVQSSAILRPISGRGRINTDAQVIRPILSSRKGVVLSQSLYPSYGDISTYHMTASAIDTVVRNTVVAGGKLNNIGILDNFCWCDSYDKGRLKELVDSTRACYDYAVGFGTPFISGKDSMFNDFNGYDEKGNKIKVSVPPTLLISSISVMPEISKTVSPEFKNEGDLIILLGDTDEELGGSEYFKLLNEVGNNVPMVNIKKNLKVYKAVESLIEKELLNSAMSVTSGGLAVALAKASIGGKVGIDVSIDNLPGEAKSTEAKLFGESQGRVLISINPKDLKKAKVYLRGVSYSQLGKVTRKDFVIQKFIKGNVEKLTKAYHSFSESMK